MKTYLDSYFQAFIRYFDFPGDEPAIVFLAGLGLASTAIYPRVTIEPGLSNQRSILVDLFGCGYSDRPENYTYSLEEHAITLSGLLDHIGARHYILVGHSLGGSVAIELAAHRPDLIVQIILAEANIDAGGGPWSRKIADQSESDFVRIGYAETIANQHSAALAADTASAVALGMWQVAYPLGVYRSAVSVVKGTRPVMWENLIQLPIPRTFLFGSRSLEEYEGDRELYTRLDAHGIRVDVVPNAGHGMMTENPSGFANAVNKALLLTARRKNIKLPGKDHDE